MKKGRSKRDVLLIRRARQANLASRGLAVAVGKRPTFNVQRSTSKSEGMASFKRLVRSRYPAAFCFRHPNGVFYVRLGPQENILVGGPRAAHAWSNAAGKLGLGRKIRS